MSWQVAGNLRLAGTPDGGVLSGAYRWNVQPGWRLELPERCSAAEQVAPAFHQLNFPAQSAV